MNHEKHRNHLAGCSFILSVGQLCRSACVAPECVQSEARVSVCAEERGITISPLMSDTVCVLICAYVFVCVCMD